MDWRQHKAKLMQDPEFRAEYEALEPAYQLARFIIRQRIKAGLSQTSLAHQMHTRQPVVSRLENGSSDPRFSTVQKLAEAVGTEITLTFRPTKNGTRAKE